MPPDAKTRSIVEMSREALEVFYGGVERGHEEFISRFRRSILNELLKFDELHSKRGGSRSFVCVDTSKLLVRWHKDILDDPRALQKLRNRSRIYLWMRDLDDRQYECFGAALMQSLGATKVHLTPRGNEFGIDFLALVPAYSRSELFVSGSRGIRVVGQSKLYKSKVPRDSIQAFNNLMDSIRHNRHEIRSIIPAWFRNSPAPLIGLWAAHRGYQEGARIISEQNGYILLDTLMMAEIFGSSKSLQGVCNSSEMDRMMWSCLTEFEALGEKVGA